MRTDEDEVGRALSQMSPSEIERDHRRWDREWGCPFLRPLLGSGRLIVLLGSGALHARARQSPANRMHCKINVCLGQSHCSSRSLAQKSTARRVARNPSGSVGQTSVFLCPPLSSSLLFCYASFSSDRQTEANSPWDMRTWNILFSHSTTRRRHSPSSSARSLARSANVPLPAPSAPSLRAEGGGSECDAGARFACG